MTTPEPTPAEAAPVEATPVEAADATVEAGPATPPPPPAVRSHLTDGEWHRLHPLTPLLRGGLTLLVILGIVVANLRDVLIERFLPSLGEGGDDDEIVDPFAYLIEKELLVVALLAVVGLVVVLIALFWVSWRFHTFRITGDDVEVRSGVLFRTHRRAPLDRVQGVNLTRPAIARLLGAAKLEVVGAGLDSNVKLEYLSTANAETIRGDILRLASGRQQADAAQRAVRAGAASAGGRVATTLMTNLGEIVEGVQDDDTEPESVVRIPPGRLILAQLLSGSTLAFLVLVVAVIVAAAWRPLWLLAALAAIVPSAIAFGVYSVRQIIRSFRYSIAPTSAGVRITFGLLTTVTETLPPGRVHAVEVVQPMLWRWGGWWRIRVNRLSGLSSAGASVQAADVLPIGTRDDVERVLRLLLPSFEIDRAALDAALLGRGPDEGFTTSPRRARWLLPLSWRRNGFRLTDQALVMRRGRVWPRMVVLPLARLQSLGMSQGPLARAFRVAHLTGHTVLGPVSGEVSSLDRDDVQAVWAAASAAVIAASTADRSHRWAEADDVPADPASVPSAAPAVDSDAATAADSDIDAGFGADAVHPPNPVTESESGDAEAAVARPRVEVEWPDAERDR